MRVWWWKETVVNANWKMAQEAFHEGYHVMATHPQLTYGLGEDYPVDNTEYTAFENGHARFQSRSAWNSFALLCWRSASARFTPACADAMVACAWAMSAS